MRGKTRVIAVIAAAFLMPAFAGSADALAKKGKIHVCYVTKGSDKGAMRFVRGKKCRKGEKSLSWNKKGLPGPAGTPGQTGQTGPAGPAGDTSQDTIDQLRAQVDQQATRIADLETQLGQLTTQYNQLAGQLGALTGQVTGLGTQVGSLDGQFTAFKTTTCTQLTDLTEQSNDMGTALDGFGLGGTIPVGLNLVSPAAPTALSTFSC